ncbi:MAG: patatin-like phospholipase family protein [Gordonia sp. (in: high G+C Gram-positive bacteria)]|uniref:patatin-like phospholipase family protein n=1 Tax=Gordonia sp. (in: high G+C Gram-positive bacteria) TaxID=84139 RepID=UPI003BB4BEBB
MTTAVVLSGGANLGAIQVGMLRALAERGVVPDLLVGTSVGALNAAVVAEDGLTMSSVERLADIWRSLRARDVFPPDPLHLISALRGRSQSLFTDTGLRRLIDESLTVDALEGTRIPLIVVTTDILTGREVDLGWGPLTDALLASSAIPGLFPPVRWRDRMLVDGGVADNTSLAPTITAGADTVYVLPTGYACALTEPPGDAASMALHGTTLLIHKRLIREIDEYSAAADLIVLPPPCPLDVSPRDFGRAEELMDRAYHDAIAALAIDGGRRRQPSRMIGLHTHDGQV